MKEVNNRASANSAFYLGALLIGMCTAPMASGEIYKWVDENGKVHFGDSAPSDRAAEVIKPPTPTAKAPDEGDLRRMKLVQHYQQQVRQQRENDDRNSTKSQNDDQAGFEKCRWARVTYGIYDIELPVYTTNSGELRVHWANDTFQGERHYIADNDRPQLLKSARADIQRYCADPDNTETQNREFELWEHTQWCAAKQADLELARSRRSRTPEEELDAMEAEVREQC